MKLMFLFVRATCNPKLTVDFLMKCISRTALKPHLFPACTFYTWNASASSKSQFIMRRSSLIQHCDGHQEICTASSCYNMENRKDFEPTKSELAPRQNFFHQLKGKDKETFLLACETYASSDKVRRGHVEFIYAALKCMEEFGVERDLEAYKKIMNVFPKGKMIPKNLIQAEFYHFPRQQECGTFLLNQMEDNDVFPDDEMKDLIVNIFGRSSHVYKRYARMMYWGPKLKNISPYVLPNPLPSDAEKLAHLAMKRISVDLRAQIVHYKAEELEDSLDKTWIVSSQSPDQMKLIKDHPVDQPLFVEGSFLVWLKRISISFFILRAAPKPQSKTEDEVDLDDVSNLSLHMFGLPKPPNEVAVSPSSVHEQDDGTIMAICATGTSSKDSLLSWIRFLQRTNPKLSEIPVLFTLRSPPTAVTTINMRPESVVHDAENSDEQELHKKAMQD